MFWCIFQNSYYHGSIIRTKLPCYNMESLQIIDKFFSGPLVIFLNMTYIFVYSYKPSFFHFLSPWFSYDLCLLNFHCTIFQYPSRKLFDTLVLLFSLHTESKILMQFTNTVRKPQAKTINGAVWLTG